MICLKTTLSVLVILAVATMSTYKLLTFNEILRAIREGHEGKGVIETIRRAPKELLFMVDDDPLGGKSLLMYAAAYNRRSVVRHLVEFGANVNQRSNFYGRPMNTPLIYAASWGHAEMVELLLSFGAIVDIQGNMNSTALMFAAVNGHLDSTRLLLDAGASLDLQDTKGQTALALASWYGHADIVKLLLERGANPNVQRHMRYSGSTPLMRAQVARQLGIVSTLTQAGASLNMQDAYGYTVSHYMAEARDEDALKIVLPFCPDLAIREYRANATAFELALDQGHLSTAELLRSHENDGCLCLSHRRQNDSYGVTNIVETFEEYVSGNDSYLMEAENDKEVRKISKNILISTLEKEYFEMDDVDMDDPDADSRTPTEGDQGDSDLGLHDSVGSGEIYPEVTDCGISAHHSESEELRFGRSIAQSTDQIYLVGHELGDPEPSEWEASKSELAEMTSYESEELSCDRSVAQSIKQIFLYRHELGDPKPIELQSIKSELVEMTSYESEEFSCERSLAQSIKHVYLDSHELDDPEYAEWKTSKSELVEVTLNELEESSSDKSVAQSIEYEIGDPEPAECEESKSELVGMTSYESEELSCDRSVGLSIEQIYLNRHEVRDPESAECEESKSELVEMTSYESEELSCDRSVAHFIEQIYPDSHDLCDPEPAEWETSKPELVEMTFKLGNDSEQRSEPESNKTHSILTSSLQENTEDNSYNLIADNPPAALADFESIDKISGNFSKAESDYNELSELQLNGTNDASELATDNTTFPLTNTVNIQEILQHDNAANISHIEIVDEKDLLKPEVQSAELLGSQIEDKENLLDHPKLKEFDGNVSIELELQTLIDPAIKDVYEDSFIDEDKNQTDFSETISLDDERTMSSDLEETNTLDLTVLSKQNLEDPQLEEQTFLEMEATKINLLKSEFLNKQDTGKIGYDDPSILGIKPSVGQALLQVEFDQKKSHKLTIFEVFSHDRLSCQASDEGITSDFQVTMDESLFKHSVAFSESNKLHTIESADTKISEDESQAMVENNYLPKPYAGIIDLQQQNLDDHALLEPEAEMPEYLDNATQDYHHGLLMKESDDIPSQLNDIHDQDLLKPNYEPVPSFHKFLRLETDENHILEVKSEDDRPELKWKASFEKSDEVQFPHKADKHAIESSELKYSETSATDKGPFISTTPCKLKVLDEQSTSDSELCDASNEMKYCDSSSFLRSVFLATKPSRPKVLGKQFTSERTTNKEYSFSMEPSETKNLLDLEVPDEYDSKFSDDQSAPRVEYQILHESEDNKGFPETETFQKTELLKPEFDDAYSVFLEPFTNLPFSASLSPIPEMSDSKIHYDDYILENYVTVNDESSDDEEFIYNELLVSEAYEESYMKADEQHALKTPDFPSVQPLESVSDTTFTDSMDDTLVIPESSSITENILQQEPGREALAHFANKKINNSNETDETAKDIESDKMSKVELSAVDDKLERMSYTYDLPSNVISENAIEPNVIQEAGMENIESSEADTFVEGEISIDVFQVLDLDDTELKVNQVTSKDEDGKFDIDCRIDTDKPENITIDKGKEIYYEIQLRKAETMQETLATHELFESISSKWEPDLQEAGNKENTIDEEVTPEKEEQSIQASSLETLEETNINEHVDLQREKNEPILHSNTISIEEVKSVYQVSEFDESSLVMDTMFEPTHEESGTIVVTSETEDQYYFDTEKVTDGVEKDIDSSERKMDDEHRTLLDQIDNSAIDVSQEYNLMKYMTSTLAEDEIINLKDIKAPKDPGILVTDFNISFPEDAVTCDEIYNQSNRYGIKIDGEEKLLKDAFPSHDEKTVTDNVENITNIETPRSDIMDDTVSTNTKEIILQSENNTNILALFPDNKEHGSGFSADEPDNFLNEIELAIDSNASDTSKCSDEKYGDFDTEANLEPIKSRGGNKDDENKTKAEPVTVNEPEKGFVVTNNTEEDDVNFVSGTAAHESITVSDIDKKISDLKKVCALLINICNIDAGYADPIPNIQDTNRDTFVHTSDSLHGHNNFSVSESHTTLNASKDGNHEVTNNHVDKTASENDDVRNDKEKTQLDVGNTENFEVEISGTEAVSASQVDSEETTEDLKVMKTDFETSVTDAADKDSMSSENITISDITVYCEENGEVRNSKEKIQFDDVEAENSEVEISGSDVILCMDLEEATIDLKVIKADSETSVTDEAADKDSVSIENIAIEYGTVYSDGNGESRNSKEMIHFYDVDAENAEVELSGADIILCMDLEEATVDIKVINADSKASVTDATEKDSLSTENIDISGGTVNYEGNGESRNSKEKIQFYDVDAENAEVELSGADIILCMDLEEATVDLKVIKAESETSVTDAADNDFMSVENIDISDGTVCYEGNGESRYSKEKSQFDNVGAENFEVEISGTETGIVSGVDSEATEVLKIKRTDFETLVTDAADKDSMSIESITISDGTVCCEGDGEGRNSKEKIQFDDVEAGNAEVEISGTDILYMDLEEATMELKIIKANFETSVTDAADKDSMNIENITISDGTVFSEENVEIRNSKEKIQFDNIGAENSEVEISSNEAVSVSQVNSGKVTEILKVMRTDFETSATDTADNNAMSSENITISDATIYYKRNDEDRNSKEAIQLDDVDAEKSEAEISSTDIIPCMDVEEATVALKVTKDDFENSVTDAADKDYMSIGNINISDALAHNEAQETHDANTENIHLAHTDLVVHPISSPGNIEMEAIEYLDADAIASTEIISQNLSSAKTLGGESTVRNVSNESFERDDRNHATSVEYATDITYITPDHDTVAEADLLDLQDTESETIFTNILDIDVMEGDRYRTVSAEVPENASDEGTIDVSAMFAEIVESDSVTSGAADINPTGALSLDPDGDSSAYCKNYDEKLTANPFVVTSDISISSEFDDLSIDYASDTAEMSNSDKFFKTYTDDEQNIDIDSVDAGDADLTETTESAVVTNDLSENLFDEEIVSKEAISKTETFHSGNKVSIIEEQNLNVIESEGKDFKPDTKSSSNIIQDNSTKSDGGSLATNLNDSELVDSVGRKLERIEMENLIVAPKESGILDDTNTVHEPYQAEIDLETLEVMENSLERAFEPHTESENFVEEATEEAADVVLAQSTNRASEANPVKDIDPVGNQSNTSNTINITVIGKSEMGNTSGFNTANATTLTIEQEHEALKHSRSLSTAEISEVSEEIIAHEAVNKNLDKDMFLGKMVEKLDTVITTAVSSSEKDNPSIGLAENSFSTTELTVTKKIDGNIMNSSEKDDSQTGPTENPCTTTEPTVSKQADANLVSSSVKDNSIVGSIENLLTTTKSTVTEQTDTSLVSSSEEDDSQIGLFENPHITTGPTVSEQTDANQVINSEKGNSQIGLSENPCTTTKPSVTEQTDTSLLSSSEKDDSQAGLSENPLTTTEPIVTEQTDTDLVETVKEIPLENGTHANISVHELPPTDGTFAIDSGTHQNEMEVEYTLDLQKANFAESSEAETETKPTKVFPVGIVTADVSSLSLTKEGNDWKISSSHDITETTAVSENLDEEQATDSSSHDITETKAVSEKLDEERATDSSSHDIIETTAVSENLDEERATDSSSHDITEKTAVSENLDEERVTDSSSHDITEKTAVSENLDEERAIEVKEISAKERKVISQEETVEYNQN